MINKSVKIINIANSVDITHINEMSTMIKRKDGYGFEMCFYPTDHPPPHAHIKQLDSNAIIAKIRITKKTPKSSKDIKIIVGSLTKHTKECIIEWANKEDEVFGNNWKRMIRMWNDHHDDDTPRKVKV